jgi:ferrochelatase
VFAFSSKLFPGLSAYPAEVRSKVTIVFSAHSLPIRVVARGDQYPPEICASAMEVIQQLRARTSASSSPNPYIMAWQSQVCQFLFCLNRFRPSAAIFFNCGVIAL